MSEMMVEYPVLVASPILVGSRTNEEVTELLHQGKKFQFTGVDRVGDILIYEVFLYSKDNDVALFISTPETIIYEAVYEDVAQLLEHEPFDSLSKFIIALP